MYTYKTKYVYINTGKMSEGKGEKLYFTGQYVKQIDKRHSSY